MSQVVNSLRSGDQGATKENWSYLIQSLYKTTGAVSENDINNLIQQVVSNSFPAVGIIGSPSPEESINDAGDDGQLANVDLQNVLQQQQQQILQMISNITKMLNDTAMAVIKKIAE